MNVTEILDQVLERDDQIDQSSADNATRRKRLLDYLREVQEDVWWRHDWTWKRRREIVTVLAGAGSVALPESFNSFGFYGGVYRPTDEGGPGNALELVAESIISDLRERGIRTDEPRVFALFGQDAISNLQYIQVQYNDGPVPLAVHFQPNPPIISEVVGTTGKTDIAVTAVVNNTATLTSGATNFTTLFSKGDYFDSSGFTNSENNGLMQVIGVPAAASMAVRKVYGALLVAEIAGATVNLVGHVNAIRQIPEKYHQRVLVAGLRARSQNSKNDARWQTEEARYEAAIGAMKREEVRFQGQMRRLPSYFGR